MELGEEIRRLKKVYAIERLKEEIIAETMQKVVSPILMARDGATGSKRQGNWYPAVQYD